VGIDGIRRALTLRFTRRHIEREIEEELADHVERRAQALIDAGMQPASARAEAARRFGDPAALRDACLSEDLPQWRRLTMQTAIEQLLGDFRFAIRALRHAPGFTAVVLGTLIVGIASVTAIFSFVYSFYWRPLPYHDAARIVAIAASRPAEPSFDSQVSPAVASRLAHDMRSFERVSAWSQSASDAVIGDQPHDIAMLLVDSSFAPLFALRAQIGRLPSLEEYQSGAKVLAISDEIWRSAFGGDSTVINRRIHIGDDDPLIIGVLPAGFGFPQRTDALGPLPPPPPTDVSTANEQTVSVLAKLRLGITRAEAAAELSVVANRITRDPALRTGAITLSMRPEMLDRRANQMIPMPSLFIGAATLLLLIACSNVANLLLVRAAERRGEMAVRASLGAGRGRLIRQALAEMFLLALVAGTLGALASALLVKVMLRAFPPGRFPAWVSFGLDTRVLAFTLLVVLTVTIVVGLTPAREGTRFDLSRALKVGGDGGIVSSNATRAARRGLTIQLALSIALFIAAGLFVQTYRNVSRIDFGYRAEQTVDAGILFRNDRYVTAASRLQVAMSVAERGASKFWRATIRGSTEPALISNGVPAAHSTPARAVGAPDYRLIPDGDTVRAVKGYRVRARDFAVDDRYFDLLGILKVSGRLFDDKDQTATMPSVVLSQQLATLLWPRQNPLGHTLQHGLHGPAFTVVGVVRDVHDLTGGSRGYNADANAYAYYSIRQVETEDPHVLIEGSAGTVQIASEFPKLLASVDRQLVSYTGTLGGAAPVRFVTRVFGVIMGTFAVAGLLLSVIGLYGVVAYGVDQRRREIGVRIALGATSERIVQMIVSQSLRFVLAGLAIGLVLALAAGRLFRVVLFQVSALDPATYLVACALFTAVAIAACWFPARRAAGINPVSALKSD
jgi:putative ABC transport system permease protein